MVIRGCLDSSNRMSVRIFAGMFLAFCGIILTSAVMGVLLFALSHIGLGVGMVVAILFLVTFPGCYFLVAKLPDVDIRMSKIFKLFTLLVFLLLVLITLFISFVAAPPTTPPRHISFAN